jgi:LysM repeat protein
MSQTDSSPQMHRPTSQWQAGEYAEVALWLSLPGDLPPGDYTLYALVTDQQTGQRLPAASGDLTDDGRVRLGVLKLLLTATATATLVDPLPPGPDCAVFACTPTPVLCYGHCPNGHLTATPTPLLPCEPAVAVCPDGTPTPTPCQVGCPDGTPTPTPPPPGSGLAHYTVQAGDTCQGIAAAYDLPLEAFEFLNADRLDCAHLVTGQVLLVPVTPVPPVATPYSTYTVQAGDTCQGIADLVGLPLDVLLFHNGLSDCSSLSVGQVLVLPLAPMPSPTPCQVGCPATPSATPPPRPT